jgi:hypothetical protein
MLRQDPDVRLTVTKEGLFHDGAAVFPGQEAFLEFAREFYARRLAEVRFHAGVTVEEIIELLRALDLPEQEITSGGGVEARLWEQGVVNITVREATTRIVTSDSAPGDLEPGEEWPPDPSTIDEALTEHLGGRPRDHRVLVRLVESPGALIEYFEASAQGRGTTPPATWMTSRVSALAAAMLETEPDERIPRVQAISDGLLELDEAQLRDLLEERMLTEARHDEALAEVVRRMGVDEVCRVLATGLEDSAESREGLTRAFRNLLYLSDLEDRQVMGAIGQALRQTDAPDAAAQILSDVRPSQITVRESTESAERSQVERIVRILNMAPIDDGPQDAGSSGEPQWLAHLASEAREGITDGAVLGAMVTLITIEQRDEQFSSLMSIVEDGLGLLITRGEYTLAATVTDALAEAVLDDERPEHQRERIGQALDELASKPNTRAIAAAMRRHDPDTLEYQACRHLLGVLGHHAIAPLLEVLADEPDMSARKAIVALISEMAEEHIAELGKRLADDRWYFVRNIVTILGATRTPETLQLLGRTLRYPDARVRRETLRAISNIRDALSIEMLLAALEDDDAQNVQLAVRYLGMSGSRAVIGALETVADGRGRGNRDTQVRIEAIESLGRLRSTGSLALLRSLTRTRTIRGRAASREIAAAANAAIRRLEGGDER